MFFVQHYKELSSTNAFLLEEARRGAPEGTVVVAERQTAGRGRLRREWRSPLGGLYLSALFRPQSPEEKLSHYPLIAGLSVHDTVSFFVHEKNVSLKWPNDCLLENKKVAGVLCEGIEGGVVVGIGVNVNLTAEDVGQIPRTVYPATSLAIETGENISVGAVETKLLERLAFWIDRYRNESFSTLQKNFEARAAFLGQWISIRENSADENSPLRAGYFTGIDGEGRLLLSPTPGSIQTVVSGEIACS